MGVPSSKGIGGTTKGWYGITSAKGTSPLASLSQGLSQDRRWAMALGATEIWALFKYHEIIQQVYSQKIRCFSLTDTQTKTQIFNNNDYLNFSYNDSSLKFLAGPTTIEFCRGQSSNSKIQDFFFGSTKHYYFVDTQVIVKMKLLVRFRCI